MNTTTDKSIKQYILTLKAGEKKTETLPIKKRQLLSQFVANKSIKAALIVCNQKRSVTSTLKHLEKEYPNSVLALSSISKEDKEAIEKAKNTPLFIVATRDEIKGFDIKINVSHIINLDFPTKANDYTETIELALTRKSKLELWSFVSPDDEKIIASLTGNGDTLIQLGRLKGHRNINLSVDLKAKEVEAKKDKDALDSKEKAQEKKTTKASSKKKETKEPKAKKAKEEETQEEETVVSKTRSRRKKSSEEESQERLPKKRTRRRKSDEVLEAKEDDAPIVEEEHSELKLDIEIKAIDKPKVRRSPQGRVIGMGEHTPAFMLKEIIFKNSILDAESD
ncbi:MAG: helicase-related protein [Alphaproteobacteria bacterium]